MAISIEAPENRVSDGVVSLAPFDLADAVTGIKWDADPEVQHWYDWPLTPPWNDPGTYEARRPHAEGVIRGQPAAFSLQTYGLVSSGIAVGTLEPSSACHRAHEFQKLLTSRLPRRAAIRRSSIGGRGEMLSTSIAAAVRSIPMWRRCAWLVVAVAGCGDDPKSSLDASITHDAEAHADARSVDSAIDAPADTLACTSNGTTGPVTVDGPSIDLGTSVGVTVLAHDASGAVIHRSSLLAADATYTLDVPSCGMVTVHQIEQPQQNVRIVTWTGVQPGDHLVDPRRAPATSEHTVDVTVSAVTGATQYYLAVACPGGRGSYGFVSMGLTTRTINCPVGATTISVLARAEGASTTSFAVIDNVTLAANGSTAVTLNAWQPAAGSVTASINGLTSFASGYGVVTTLRAAVADRLPSYDYTFETLPSGNFTFQPVSVMSGAGDVVVQLESASSATPRRSLVHRASFTAFPTTLALSVGVDTLPLLSASIGSNALRPMIVWSAAGALQADGFAAEVRYRSSTQWLLSAPAVPGSVLFPVLPTDLEPVEPTVDRLMVLAANPVSVTGYDAIRPQLSRLAIEDDGVLSPQTSTVYVQ